MTHHIIKRARGERIFGQTDPASEDGMRTRSCGKRSGAPQLHGDGIRSSGDVASGKAIGQVFVAVDAP